MRGVIPKEKAKYYEVLMLDPSIILTCGVLSLYKTWSDAA